MSAAQYELGDWMLTATGLIKRRRKYAEQSEQRADDALYMASA